MIYHKALLFKSSLVIEVVLVCKWSFDQGFIT